MTEPNQNQDGQPQPPDPNANRANTPAATQGHPTTSPHITQAPGVAPVEYAELQQHVTAERSVHNGVRSMVTGIRQRVEELASDESKDANTLRAELHQLASSLDADAWARSIVDNTPAKRDADPQSNPPVAPQINR